MSVELRKISVTVEGAEDIDPYHVTVTCGVNAMPTVAIRGSGAPDMVESASAPDIQTVISNLKRQQNMLGKPSAKITINDGKNTVNAGPFLLSAPSATIDEHSIGESIYLIHPDHACSGINMTIYVKPEGTGSGTQVSGASTYLLEKARLGEPLLQVIGNYVEDMLSWGDSQGLKTHQKAVSEVLSGIHDNNKELFDTYFSGIAYASMDTVTVPDVADIQGGIDIATFGTEIESMVSNSSNLLDMIRGVIIPRYLLQQVTPWDSGIGGTRFMHSQTAASVWSEQTVDLSSGRFNFGGALGELVLGQVVVSTAIRTSTGQGTQAEFALKTQLADGYPSTVLQNSRTMSVSAPGWLQPSLHDPTRGVSQGSDTLTEGNTDRNVDGNVSKITARVDKLREEDIPACQKLLKDWAEKHYYHNYLASSSGQITIPLDVKWGTDALPPGRVYTISVETADDSVELFDGYLRQVVHQINKSPENGQAVTTLDFSHCRASADWKHGPTRWVE
jgi:hypothetical protein